MAWAHEPERHTGFPRRAGLRRLRNIHRQPHTHPAELCEHGTRPVQPTVRMEPPLKAQVEAVLQVDIRTHGADRPSLRYPVSPKCDHTVLHHAGIRPFVHEPHKYPIVGPMQYELPAQMAE